MWCFHKVIFFNDTYFGFILITSCLKITVWFGSVCGHLKPDKFELFLWYFLPHRRNLQGLCEISDEFYSVQFPSERILGWDRNSRPEVFCKKCVLRDFAKFTGKHLYQRLFFNEVAGPRLLQNTPPLAASGETLQEIFLYRNEKMRMEDRLLIAWGREAL